MNCVQLQSVEIKTAEEDIQNHVNTLKGTTLVNIMKIVHILIQRTRIQMLLQICSSVIVQIRAQLLVVNP